MLAAMAAATCLVRAQRISSISGVSWPPLVLWNPISELPSRAFGKGGELGVSLHCSDSIYRDNQIFPLRSRLKAIYALMKVRPAYGEP